jgi:hypothetical protein
MLILPLPHICNLSKALLWWIPRKYADRVSKTITKEEIIAILEDAINICYLSRGEQIPTTIKQLIRLWVKIDFRTLPNDLKDNIRGIILCSDFAKKIFKKFILNLPN